MMRLELATEAFIGARSQQQDSAGLHIIDESKHAAILVLADGLGGHEGGAEASKIVVRTFLDAAKAGAFTEPDRRHRALRDAIDAANKSIAGGVDPAHGQRSMASTAVVAIVAEGSVSWISVGDSHLYVWRKGKLTKLNEDHSQAGLMVRSGQYKDDDPEVQAAKSVLVSALTGRKLEIVDHPQQAFPLDSGDVLVLASDGLNTISEAEITGIITNGGSLDAKSLSTALIDAVKERRADRQDNTTVAISRVLAAPKRAAGAANVEPVRPRQEITTPTEVSPANQRTQVQPAPKLRAADGVEPPTERADAPASVTVVPPKPGARPHVQAASPSAANARTAMPAAAAVRTALPAGDRVAPAAVAPELRSTTPMAPMAPMPKPSRLPLIGLLMLALATIFGGLFIGRMLGVFDPIGAVFAPAEKKLPPAIKTQTPAQAVPPSAPPTIQQPPQAPPPVQQPVTPPPPQPQAPAQLPTPPQSPPPQQQKAPPGAARPAPGAVPKETDTPRFETAPASPPNAASPQVRPEETPPLDRNQTPGNLVPPTEGQTPKPQGQAPLPPTPRAAAPRVLPADRGGGFPVGPGVDPRLRQDIERARPQNERRDAEFRRSQQDRASGECRPFPDGTKSYASRDLCYDACHSYNQLTDRRVSNPRLSQCLVTCNDFCP